MNVNDIYTKTISNKIYLLKNKEYKLILKKHI